MASKRARITCSLPALLLQPCSCEASTAALETLFRDTKSEAPLRDLLERRSDSAFLNPLRDQLCSDAGLSEPVAGGHLVAVVNKPAVALRRPAGTGADILQAVLVERSGSDADEPLLVVLRANVSPGKPPQVAHADVDIYPLDPSALADQCLVAEELEGWWHDYRVRKLTPPPAGAPQSLAWLGDPRASGYLHVPNNWETRVRVAGSVLGMNTFIAKSVDEARAQALHEQAELVVRLQSLRRWEVFERLFAEVDPEVVVVGGMGSGFQDLLGKVRELVVPRVLQPIQTDIFDSRDLEPGETIYHRKVGSGRHFDHFDEGSRSPCKHGEDSFVLWGSRDKAFKGLARRYSNFDSNDVRMLHCQKYPNCGMYAVRRRT